MIALVPGVVGDGLVTPQETVRLRIALQQLFSFWPVLALSSLLVPLFDGLDQGLLQQLLLAYFLVLAKRRQRPPFVSQAQHSALVRVAVANRPLGIELVLRELWVACIPWQLLSLSWGTIWLVICIH